jgi:hypothetical protein
VDEFDIHNRRKHLERVLVRLKNSEFSETNKSLILRFLDECVSTGLTLDRILFYLDKLQRIARFLKKDLTEAKIEEIKEF